MKMRTQKTHSVDQEKLLLMCTLHQCWIMLRVILSDKFNLLISAEKKVANMDQPSDSTKLSQLPDNTYPVSKTAASGLS